MKAQSDAKASIVELVVLLVLCPLAGVGAGLAFASALVGLGVGGVGLISVAVYALAINIDRWPPRRPEEPRRLSVTDISTRRRVAPAQEDIRPEERGPAPPVEPDEAPDVAPIVVTTAEPDRVIPFRTPFVRL